MISIYKIAEIFASMEPKYEPLISQSKPYLWNDTETDIDCDLSVSPETYAAYKARYPDAENSLIEYMETGSVFYRSLISHAGFLLHASAVVYENKAYLFSAPSGTGKSTHTSLWLKEFPGSEILNDDKPAIRIFEDGIYVYGTPWSGKTDQSINRKVPLQGIAFLERGTENKISPMPGFNALTNLLNQTIRPGEKECANKLLDLINQIIKKVPIYRFSCNTDPSSAHISYETMSKGEVK